jgi:hypothetical protein
MAEVYGSGY